MNIKVMTTAKKEKMIIKKKVSIKNNNFHMFKTFNIKGSIERISTKLVIDDITLFSSISEISSFVFKEFLK